ncbi:MAG: glycosyltransferase family 4 protein [Kiritimatiellia bacterium]
MKPALRVCWFGTWREEYSRNRILLKGLRRNGVEVVECHAPLWGGIEDRVHLAQGGWTGPRFWLRAARAYLSLIARFYSTGPWDILMLGYPGQFDAYLARLLAWSRRKPLVLDAFMSPWLIASERGLTRRAPRTARLLHALEKGGLRLPDRIIQDTAQYAAWMSKEFALPADRIRLVPTGADSTRFFPRPCPPKPDGTFLVVYAGSFIPNHGVPAMIGAAEKLKADPSIRFLFIGEGPDHAAAVAHTQKNGLHQVSFEGWMEGDRLPERLAQADLCLGAFGTTPQSLMTVQNKIYEGLAMGRPVLTGDGPAVRAALAHGAEVWLCPRQDPQALADAIMALKADRALRDRLAARGNERFLEIGTVEAVGAALRRHLEELIEPHP